MKRQQVCDRCRAHKKGCYGPGDACINCVQAGAKCEVTTVLKRNRKPNTVLKLTLTISTERTEYLENRIKQLESQLNISDDPLFRHLGRLLPVSGTAEEVFAGSTTGDYFVRQIQQEFDDQFHDSSFEDSVYLAFRSPRIHYPNFPSIQFIDDLDQPYLIQKYFENWNCLYPIIDTHPKQRISYQEVLTQHNPTELYSHFMMICSAIASEDLNKSRQLFQYLQLHLLVKLMQNSSLKVLEAYLLTMLYLQLTGDSELYLQFNGMAVRLAYSFGLHRHSSRFKLPKAKIEQRKRIWWCIYIFDLLVSCNNGSPKLIKDEDVDSDLPLEYVGLDGESLTPPLPGERGINYEYISFIKLIRIFSQMLKTLYTTTDRKNGLQKITNLRIRLDNWREEVFCDNVTSPTMRLMLLQYYVILIHVYRPGLTYSKDTWGFKYCLQQSVTISKQFIQKYNDIRTEANNRVYFLHTIGFHMLFQSGLLLLFNSLLGITHQLEVDNDDFQVYIDMVLDCLKPTSNALFNNRRGFMEGCSKVIGELRDHVLKGSNSMDILNQIWGEDLGIFGISM